MSGHSSLTGAEVRARVGHPIIDGDAHIVECLFAFEDYLKKVGGADMLRRWEARQQRPVYFKTRSIWWGAPSGAHTADRAMAMLPKYFAARMGECGIDFAHMLTTGGLNGLYIRDAELRQAYARAMNEMYAELFRDVGDRIRPVAIIPTYTPEEAIAELEHAVLSLGMKAAMIGTDVIQPWPEVARAAPQLAPYAERVQSIAIDTAHDYDPLWRRCVELGIAPICHTPGLGAGYRASPSNYVFNHLGMFASGAEFFCRGLFMGGVTHRFPSLNFAFLECGVGWALTLLNDLVEHFEKRNVTYMREHLDPSMLDIDLLAELFDRYGDETLTGARIRANPHSRLADPTPPEPFDEWAASGMTQIRDLKRLFCDNFYFGCEADDRTIAVGFNRRLNPLGVKLKAAFGSDIGHWDVVDAKTVVGEAWGLVESKFIDAEDFRDFTYVNPAMLHLRMNPNYFTGTALERAAAELLSKNVNRAA